MQTSLQSFKSSQKVNILDGTTGKKKIESMQKGGQCDCDLSKPEETIQLICNKKEMGFAP